MTGVVSWAGVTVLSVSAFLIITAGIAGSYYNGKRMNVLLRGRPPEDGDVAREKYDHWGDMEHKWMGWFIIGGVFMIVALVLIVAGEFVAVVSS